MTIALAPGTPDDFIKESIDPTKTQRGFKELKKALQKTEDRWKIVMDTLNQVNERSNAAFQELKGWALIAYLEKIEEANLNFFNKYPTSYATAYALQYIARDLTTKS